MNRQLLDFVKLVWLHTGVKIKSINAASIIYFFIFYYSHVYKFKAYFIPELSVHYGEKKALFSEAFTP